MQSPSGIFQSPVPWPVQVIWSYLGDDELLAESESRAGTPLRREVERSLAYCQCNYYVGLIPRVGGEYRMSAAVLFRGKAIGWLPEICQQGDKRTVSPGFHYQRKNGLLV